MSRKPVRSASAAAGRPAIIGRSTKKISASTIAAEHADLRQPRAVVARASRAAALGQRARLGQRGELERLDRHGVAALGVEADRGLHQRAQRLDLLGRAAAPRPAVPSAAVVA